MKKSFFTFFLVLLLTAIIQSPSLSHAGETVRAVKPSNSPGAQEGARRVKKEGKRVNLMGLAMAAMFASQCGPHNGWACTAAGLAAMDAMAAQKASSDGYRTCQHHGTCGDPGDGDPGDGGPGPGDGDGGPATVQSIIDPLKNQGYVFNEENGTVTTPGGETFSGDDFGSAESLMNKGMPAGQATQAMQGVADAKTKALEKVGDENKERGLASVSGGGAGGGGFSDASSVGGGEVIIEEQPYGQTGKKKKKKKDEGLSAAKAAQLSKTFNGQPIGIGMADLFMIVGEKYKEKRKRRNQFINKEY